jgi:hypothetical protein
MKQDLILTLRAGYFINLVHFQNLTTLILKNNSKEKSILIVLIFTSILTVHLMVSVSMYFCYLILGKSILY